MPNQEHFASALKRIQALFPNVADPAAQPNDFLLAIHGLWKEGGGKLAGKPRHSDRYLEDQLKAQKTQVKSLTPKLAGKTRITPADRRTLVRFFLTHWPEGDSENGEMRYRLAVAQAEIDAIAEAVERQPTSSPPEQPAPPNDPAERDLPGELNAKLIERLFRDCDAVVTVAPEQIFVSAGPGKELIGFRSLLDLMRRVEAEDGKKRPLVWVLDLGGPTLDDPATRRYYLNVQQLIIRFKALMHFKDFQSEERMDWLKSTGVVVLLDTYGPWRKRINVSKHPNFSPEHCSLINTAPEWMASPYFRALYGFNLEEERMRQRVFQVFYNASTEWETAPNVEEDLRYVGYGLFKSSNGDMVGRGLELAALSGRYAEAFRAVCAASANALDIPMARSRAIECSGEEAKGQLEYLGYRILSIDEFLAKY